MRYQRDLKLLENFLDQNSRLNPVSALHPTGVRTSRSLCLDIVRPHNNLPETESDLSVLWHGDAVDLFEAFYATIFLDDPAHRNDLGVTSEYRWS